jgi:hypothetical protein
MKLIFLFVLASPVGEQEFLQRIAALAGPDAENCASSTTSVTPITSEACLVTALQKRKAAFWLSHTRSRVSPAVYGMAVTSTGAVYVLQSETIEQEPAEYRCVEPRIIQEFGRERLRCKERYIAPFNPSESPLTVDFRVVKPPAPRRLGRILIPPELCEDQAFVSFMVEFIIDTNGKVVMAEVGSASSRDCDLPAIEDWLGGLEFRPGMWNGAPVCTRYLFPAYVEKPAGQPSPEQAHP